MLEQPKIAWCMIVKGTDDEAPLLAAALASLNGYVDAFYLDINHLPGENVSTKVRKVAEQYNANIRIRVWKHNFAKARNDNFARVPKKYDWIGWCDSDDTVENAPRIRDTIAIASHQQQAVWLKYDYDHDDYGNVTTTHWLARLVRNNGSYAWKSSFDDGETAVHETLNEVVPRPKAMSEEIKIVHHSGTERRRASLYRNIALLESMHQRQVNKGDIDPRVLFYLGTHLFDVQRLQEAKQLFEQYMQISGWAEERCEALVFLGLIYRAEDKEGQAKHAYLLAIGEYPNSPKPYLELAELEFSKGRYENMASWVEKALQLPKPVTTMVQRPMETSYKAYMLLATAYVNLGGKKLDKAQDYVTKALKLRPLDPDAKTSQKLIEQLIETRDDTKAAMRLVRLLEKDAQDEKIMNLLDMLPKELQDMPPILNTRHHYFKPVTWPKKSIAIYVGQGPLGIWGPWSLADGIGGSEEAVIRISRELTKQGYEVVVYATPGNRAGLYDGVMWAQYWEFNPNDTYDVLIAWRSPWFFDNDFKARKKYLWLHDVMEKEEFSTERLDRLDRVIFVSQYHADLFKEVIPENKRFVSGNGIDPSDFKKLDGTIKRDRHKCIYMSSHNRGLKFLYEVWPDVIKEVPDATLDVYYGWGSYDAINKDNPERMQWKDEMVRLAKKLPGVTDHGKIGQDQINQEIFKSGIFAYPCIFPEVYCISLIKAMAGGAVPITTDFAVLKDFNTHGVQVPYIPGEIEPMKEAFKTALIHQLKNNTTDNKKMMTETRNKFSWERTAQGWIDDFQKG